jgi:hypothetical protein
LHYNINTDKILREGEKIEREGKIKGREKRGKKRKKNGRDGGLSKQTRLPIL